MTEFDPKKSNILAFTYYVANCASGGTDVEMSIAGEATAADVPQMPVPWAGSIVGFALSQEAACAAGTATFVPTINGVTAASSLVLDAVTNTQYTAANWRRQLYPFTKNQRLGVQYTTTATYTAGPTQSVAAKVFFHIEE